MIDNSPNLWYYITVRGTQYKPITGRGQQCIDAVAESRILKWQSK